MQGNVGMEMDVAMNKLMLDSSFESLTSLDEAMGAAMGAAMEGTNDDLLSTSYVPPVKREAKLEALESCYWLKATGFAHYVKMYEEKKFPIDIDMAKKANNSLEDDSLMSLIKRLETLNKCAKLLQLQNNDRPGGISRTQNNHRLESNHSSDRLTYEPNGRSSDLANLYKQKEISQTIPISAFPIDNYLDIGHNSIQSFDENDEVSVSDDKCDKVNVVIAINDQIVYDTDDIGGNHTALARHSVYDNVPSGDMTMLSKSTPNDVKFAIPNDYYVADLTLKQVEENIKVVHRQCSEDDDEDDDNDDASSTSSQEELFEERVHHLNLPGHMGNNLKTSAMGSVDSGVPSSPVMRSPSVRKRRVRWHSFQKSCERESMLVSNKINSLSAGQLNVLKKISLLRLTALLERYSCNNRSGWHWTVPKLLKKLKVPDYRDKNIFGVPLLTIAERTGSPLPHSILLAINHLTRLAVDSVGIFRKSGMKARIDKLRTQMENIPDKVDFDGYSFYDIADTLKQYFRELPEPLLTSKLTDTFISIHKDIPKELRLQVMQLAILLMPDENRDVLQTLLLFLNEVASHSYINQMCEKNLATCFVPAFFHLCGGSTYKTDKSLQNNTPKKIRGAETSLCRKELHDTLAAQECLSEMMKCVRFLFCVPDDVMMKCQFSYIEQGDPVPLEELGANHVDPGVDDGYHSYIDNCFAGLVQETSPNYRSNNKWILHSQISEIEVSYRKVSDGYPLRLWRAETMIHASPEEILKRIVNERHLWDDEIIHWDVLETLDETTDVFYYETQSIAPSIKRDFVILRSWRKNINGASCGVVMTSIQHNSAPPTSGVRGTLLAYQCYIEPMSLAMSKLTYIARIDLRGRSSRYYNKALAPRIILSAVTKVRDSFNFGPDGPETNV